jgi:hypothetical protein
MTALCHGKHHQRLIQAAPMSNSTYGNLTKNKEWNGRAGKKGKCT